MPGKRALDSASEAEARRLLAAGTSARKIAQQFGVDHKTITRLARGDGPYSAGGPAQRPPPSPSRERRAPPPASEAPSDDFEAAQLRAYEILRASLEDEHDARGLSQISKAMNDTIKAIRQHRAHSVAAEGPEASDPIADTVIARLQRLNARSPQPPPASLEVVEPSEDIETGS